MSVDSSYGRLVRLARRPPAATWEMPDFSGPTLREVLPAGPSDPSAAAFVMAALSGLRRPVLWVQDGAARRENGRLCLIGWRPGVPVLGVEAAHPREVLWTMEEGAGSAALGAVVGEIHGTPKVLDFTATKRLALRSEASGVPVWLIRSGGPHGLSAARQRWRVGALPSAPDPHDARAPGAALWDAELFRARGRPPGRWTARHEPGAADRLGFLPHAGDGPLAGDGAARADAAGG